MGERYTLFCIGGGGILEHGEQVVFESVEVVQIGVGWDEHFAQVG